MGRAICVLTCLALAAEAMPPASEAPPRTVEELLEAVRQIGEPDFDAARKTEPGYLADYRRRQHGLCRRKAALILEWCRRHPSHERHAELMERRWTLLAWNQDPLDVAEEMLADAKAVLTWNQNPAVRRTAAYWLAFSRARLAPHRRASALAAIEPFLDRHPDDERCAALLELAAEGETDASVRAAIFRRAADQYPESHVGRFAPGMLRRINELGRPFDLEFDDAITGRRIRMVDLRGRVVVIDFWATTCGPCLAEMPAMKAAYAKYRPQGVEFIGVSLDEPVEAGGLSALRRVVKKLDIPWPQYYQGDGYNSAFSRNWGVGSAPTVFVIDRAGCLRETHAQGRLEEAIREQLRSPPTTTSQPGGA